MADTASFESKSSDDALRARLRALKEQVGAICRQMGRDPSEVAILLATKTVEAERLRIAVDEGFTLFGENKVQELERKAPMFASTPVKWQLIGHLQSNKVKAVLPWVECIQSVDRLSLAQELQKRLEERGARLDGLLEVNTSGEESKSGVAPDEALALARSIVSLDRIRCRGLMTLAVHSADEAAVRGCFRRLKKLQDELRGARLRGGDGSVLEWPVLSMGMSGDFAWAIEEGSTLIRVGSAVFGERS